MVALGSRVDTLQAEARRARANDHHRNNPFPLHCRLLRTRYGREGLGKGGKCTTPSDEPQLLTLDWEDTQRIDLERAMAKHVAVVHYDCNGFKVLRDCEVEGGYEYAGVSLAKTTAKLKDEDEVHANLPYGAVDISAAVKRGSTIDIVYVAVGQQATTVHDVAAAKLKGSAKARPTRFAPRTSARSRSPPARRGRSTRP